MNEAGGKKTVNLLGWERRETAFSYELVCCFRELFGAVSQQKIVVFNEKPVYYLMVLLILEGTAGIYQHAPTGEQGCAVIEQMQLLSLVGKDIFRPPVPADVRVSAGNACP